LHLVAALLIVGARRDAGAQNALPTDAGTVVNGYQDTFSGSSLATNWVISGASVFTVGGGMLHVASAGGNPNHLLYELPASSNAVQEVLARVRVTSFGSGDSCRGGVAVAVKPSTSVGVNYLFRDGSSEGETGDHTAFLADLVAWGPGQAFSWQSNQWYWLRLRQAPGTVSQNTTNDVFAKIWLADGITPEPAAWQLAWSYAAASKIPPLGGYAGLTASSGGVTTYDVNYILIKAAGLPPITASPTNGPSNGAVSSVFPPQNATVPALASVEVHFDQAVTNVTAGSLLINNVPAASVTAYAPWQYVFEFAEPAPGYVQVGWATNAAIASLRGRTNVALGPAWYYSLDRLALPPTLEISEFMAANKNTLQDEDGDSSDWIEIFNNTGADVNLAGWSLTSTPTNLTQWAFPDYVLAYGDYLVVFASAKNRAVVTNELHTNFKLAAPGGFLALVDAHTNLVSTFAPVYPPQQTDISYGRDPMLLNAVGPYGTPTPGDINLPAGPGFTPAPAFSTPGGTFLAPFTLNVGAGVANGVVRFTLDGTPPTDYSPILAGPLSITNTVQVRARVFAPGLLPGPIQSETYLQLSAQLAATTSSLPALVIYNFGAGAPDPTEGVPDMFANFAFFEPTNGLTVLTNPPTLSTRAGFHVHGSSTRGFAKQAWSVSFWDEFDNSTEQPPLELPPGKDWVLYAPDVFEPVLIHNPLMYQLSNEVGRYAPRTRMIEVYINTGGGAVIPANYNGIYVLEEKIKRGPYRVDIDNLHPDDNTQPKVTGGYMLAIDRLGPGENGLNAAGQTIVYEDPTEAEVLTPERVPQQAYIQDYMNAFYNALNSPAFTNPATGYAPYIDAASWIDHHILNVMAFNVDTLRLSAFFHKPRLGPIVFGPIWDFDRSQGSTDGRDFSPFTWRATTGDLGTDFFNYTWWGQLFTDLDFWQKWIDRYEQLRTGLLSTNHIYADIDALAGQVAAEEPREIARWPGWTTPRSGVVSGSGYSYDFPGTYAGEVAFLKQWYRDRLYFMDTNFVALPVMSPNGGALTEGLTVTLAAPPGATVYYCTDGSDPRLPGGAISPKAQVYAGPVALKSSAAIVARALVPAHRNLTGANNPPLSTPWSGPATASFGWVTSPPQLVYTNAGSVYTQNFDSLPNPGLTTVESANPVVISGVSYSLANPFGLAFPVQGAGELGGLGLSSTMPGWYGWSSLTAKAGASEGDQSTGGVISFGPTNGLAASANRALGLLATSTTGPTAFGLRLVNGSPFVLNQISLQFTGELWRQSAIQKPITFGYLIDPITTNTFSPSLTATIPQLDVSFASNPLITSPVPLDGTAAANQITLSVTNQVITNWPPGAALWLTWTMSDGAGKGQGIAIDNLQFSALPAASSLPSLSFQFSGSSLVLDWPFGHLQSATNAAGPYITLPNTTSPATVLPTSGPQVFYRVVVP